MDFFENILSSSLSILVSTAVSFFVAKAKTSHEMNKILLSYNRKDKALLNEVFSQLMVATNQYCSFKCEANKYDAIKYNTDLIAIAPEHFKPLLLELDTALVNSDENEVLKLRQKLLSLFSKHVQNSK